MSSIHELENLEREMSRVLVSDEKYWRENDAKFRAVAQNVTYEQFEDIVKTSHLKSLDKKDKSPNPKSKPSIWNSISLAGKKSSAETVNTALPEKPGHLVKSSVKNIDEFYSLWRYLEIEERIDFISELGEDNVGRIFQTEIPPELLGEMLHSFLAFRPTTQDIAAIVKTLSKIFFSNLITSMLFIFKVKPIKYDL